MSAAASSGQKSARWGACRRRSATSADPVIDLARLELPQAPHLVCGHPLVADPDVDRFLGNAQVSGDVVSGQPGLTHDGTVLKSSIRVIASSLSATPPFSSVLPGLFSFSSVPQSAEPSTASVRHSEESGPGLVRARSYRFDSRSLLLSSALLQR